MDILTKLLKINRREKA